MDVTSEVLEDSVLTVTPREIGVRFRPRKARPAAQVVHTITRWMARHCRRRNILMGEVVVESSWDVRTMRRRVEGLAEAVQMTPELEEYRVELARVLASHDWRLDTW